MNRILAKFEYKFSKTCFKRMNLKHNIKLIIQFYIKHGNLNSTQWFFLPG